MSFSSTWQTLLESVEGLPPDTSFVAPLSGDAFDIRSVRDDCITIQYRGDSETMQLQRDRFETLYRNLTESAEGFGLGRLPTAAEHYAVLLTLHPTVTFDRQEWALRRTSEPTEPMLVESPPASDPRGGNDGGSAPTVEQMMENMGTPKERVTCPIEGCNYRHRSAVSVARHVSGSSTDRHIWANTRYGGWHDFVRKHDE